MPVNRSYNDNEEPEDGSRINTRNVVTNIPQEENISSFLPFTAIVNGNILEQARIMTVTNECSCRKWSSTLSHVTGKARWWMSSLKLQNGASLPDTVSLPLFHFRMSRNLFRFAEDLFKASHFLAPLLLYNFEANRQMRIYGAWRREITKGGEKYKVRHSVSWQQLSLPGSWLEVHDSQPSATRFTSIAS